MRLRAKGRGQTWRGCSRAADIADACWRGSALLSFDELSHGSVHAGLDVAPGPHVLGLLLTPDHLGIGVLHHHLQALVHVILSLLESVACWAPVVMMIATFDTSHVVSSMLEQVAVGALEYCIPTCKHDTSHHLEQCEEDDDCHM